MSTITTYIIPFSPDQASAASPGRLLEIETTDYSVGDRIRIRIWGVSQGLINNIVLYEGCKSKGSSRTVATTRSASEVLTLSGSAYTQATFPIQRLTRIIANSDIVLIDNEEKTFSCYATAGSALNNFKRIGYSAVGLDSDVALYGSVKATYQKALYTKSWTWTVPNKTRTNNFFLVENGKFILNFSLDSEALADSVLDTRSGVTITLRDDATGVVIPYAAVTIDGVPGYATGADGTLDLNDIEVGDHSIKIEKSGYVDSDQDDISNDSFTVE